MKTIFRKIFKFDFEKSSVSDANLTNMEHIDSLIDKIISMTIEESHDREYRFDETKHTTKDYVIDLLHSNERESVAMRIAQKLLTEEEGASSKYKSITSIQRGILLVAINETENGQKKVLITKLDYDSFIEEDSGDMRNGLPTKKKIYKACSFDVILDAQNNIQFKHIYCYDSNSLISIYWAKHFLELDEIRSDKKNTQTAWESIKTEILNPIKKKSKQDFLCLWNSSVGYMRKSGGFDIQEYYNICFEGYKPFDSNLDFENYKSKVLDLPRIKQFDAKFVKDVSVIKSKIKNVIPLSPEMDLVMKQEIPQISQTIMGEIIKGKKCIIIESEEGYEYAKSKQLDKTN